MLKLLSWNIQQGEFFKIIQLDPTFAQAYIKLAEVYYLLEEYAAVASAINYALAWKYLRFMRASP